MAWRLCDTCRYYRCRDGWPGGILEYCRRPRRGLVRHISTDRNKKHDCPYHTKKRWWEKDIF